MATHRILFSTATVTAITLLVAAGSSAAAIPPQLAGTNRLVSVRETGRPAELPSQAGALSADGHVLVFSSSDPHIVLGQTVDGTQVYLRDLTTGATQLISRAPDGTPGDGASSDPDLSADGTRVAFRSEAANLAAGDTNGKADIFVFDTRTRAVRLISRGAGGDPANGPSGAPAISANGLHVAYQSYARNLTSTTPWPGTRNVFLYDAPTNQTTYLPREPSGRASDGDSGEPDVSWDGGLVVFWALGLGIVDDDDAGFNGDIYLWRRTTPGLELASSTADGEPYYGHKYFPPSISADGSTVAFLSTASGAGDPVEPGEFNNVYLRDVSSRETVLVTRGYTGVPATGQYGSYNPDLSGDGRVVTFESDATNLVPGDTNRKRDVFSYDVASGRTTLLSRAQRAPANGFSSSASISADATFVVYSSQATNLVRRDHNGVTDVFVHRLA